MNSDGYDAYLKGMHHFYRLTPQDLQTALQYFDLSLEQNPDSALALRLTCNLDQLFQAGSCHSAASWGVPAPVIL
jgi:TPR repeat protein